MLGAPLGGLIETGLGCGTFRQSGSVIGACRGCGNGRTSPIVCGAGGTTAGAGCCCACAVLVGEPVDSAEAASSEVPVSNTSRRFRPLLSCAVLAETCLSSGRHS